MLSVLILLLLSCTLGSTSDLDMNGGNEWVSYDESHTSSRRLQAYTVPQRLVDRNIDGDQYEKFVSMASIMLETIRICHNDVAATTPTAHAAIDISNGTLADIMRRTTAVAFHACLEACAKPEHVALCNQEDFVYSGQQLAKLNFNFGGMPDFLQYHNEYVCRCGDTDPYWLTPDDST